MSSLRSRKAAAGISKHDGSLLRGGRAHDWTRPHWNSFEGGASVAGRIPPVKGAAFCILLACLIVGTDMALGRRRSKPRVSRVRNAWPDLAGDFAL